LWPGAENSETTTGKYLSLMTQANISRQQDGHISAVSPKLSALSRHLNKL